MSLVADPAVEPEFVASVYLEQGADGNTSTAVRRGGLRFSAKLWQATCELHSRATSWASTR